MLLISVGSYDYSAFLSKISDFLGNHHLGSSNRSVETPIDRGSQPHYHQLIDAIFRQAFARFDIVHLTFKGPSKLIPERIYYHCDSLLVPHCLSEEFWRYLGKLFPLILDFYVSQPSSSALH